MQVQSEIVSTEDVPASVHFLSPQCTLGDVCETPVASVPVAGSLPDASAHASAQLDVGFEETPVLACSVSLLATSHQSVEDYIEVVPVFSGSCLGRRVSAFRRRLVVVMGARLSSIVFYHQRRRKICGREPGGRLSDCVQGSCEFSLKLLLVQLAGCWEIVWYWCSCCVIVWVPPRNLYGRCVCVCVCVF